MSDAYPRDERAGDPLEDPRPEPGPGTPAGDGDAPGAGMPAGENEAPGSEAPGAEAFGSAAGPAGAPAWSGPEGADPGAPGAAAYGEEALRPDEAGRLEVARERDEYLDALRRLQADFENYKKRVARQQADQLARAAEGLIEKLLPVLDTADLALAHGGGDEVKQLSAALVDALEREGLERIDPLGAAFDPNLHDAVAHEPADGGAQEVVEVLRAGYRWKGRVLRPAMVKVRG